MTSPTDRFAFPKPTDTDSADLPTQLGNIVEQVEDRLGYAGAQGGESIVDTEQSRTNTAYGYLGTPDRVQGLTLPRDKDLIVVGFQAMMKSSGAALARAALFINATDQFKMARNAAAPATVEARGTGTDSYVPIASCFAGIVSGTNASAYTGDVSTGQGIGVAEGGEVWFPGAGVGITGVSLGGLCHIQGLAAGTYEVGVMFKSSSGSVSVKNRRLWAWTKEFPASGV